MTTSDFGRNAEIQTKSHQQIMLSFSVTNLVHFFSLVLVVCSDSNPFPGDILTPYKDNGSSRRSKRSLRFIRDCQPVYYGNVTHEEFQSSRTTTGPFLTTKHFLKGLPSVNGGKRYVTGHVTWLDNPLKTFSILEPKGPGKGCLNRWFGKRETVQNSAKQRNCSVAINAGYFRVSTGACLGNIFSDGRFVQDAGGIQNANFGIKSDGTIMVGYLPEEMIHDTRNPFSQLVTGVLWLVRNGTVFVNESKKLECPDLEETGTLDLFANVLSGRTALGHDSKGRVMFVQVDGKTHHTGLNLYDFASLLQEFGIVNAINLDGGGSSTYVVDDVIVNYPSDACGKFNCPRMVSTIACGHAPDCDPEDCGGHGHCEMGQCVCEESWEGSSCDELRCLKDGCSGHGNCTEAGCECLPGWQGVACSDACPNGTFGKNCLGKCKCSNDAPCRKTDGKCLCLPGWTGFSCEQGWVYLDDIITDLLLANIESQMLMRNGLLFIVCHCLACLPGSFGKDCQYLCDCPESCLCHPSTGSCVNVSLNDSSSHSSHWLQCVKQRDGLTDNHQESNFKEKDQVFFKDYRTLFLCFIAAVSLCAISVVANLVLLYLHCHVSPTRSNSSTTRYKDTSEASHGLLETAVREEI